MGKILAYLTWILPSTMPASIGAQGIMLFTRFYVQDVNFFLFTQYPVLGIDTTNFSPLQENEDENKISHFTTLQKYWKANLCNLNKFRICWYCWLELLPMMQRNLAGTRPLACSIFQAGPFSNLKKIKFKNEMHGWQSWRACRGIKGKCLQ
jgi:hypothetical protein